ncbi:MAG TPA: alpha/beta fold hydrolase [Stellaceae bacterium]|nr:alpha/beta fold hydrolase [Stellaceae bacterium]
MPHLDRDRVAIYYEVHGAGPPILLSHGYSATCHMWDGQVAAFADRYRLVLWDMRGHGRSGDPDDPGLYSTRASVEDMAALLRHLGIERAIVGGLSLGGYMSLAFHLAHPEMVSALMLFDTGPGYRNPQARAEWNERAQARAREIEARGLAILGREGDPRVGRHRSAKGLALAARGMLAQADGAIIESLPAIDVPTLVLVGALDRNFIAPADYMAAKIPRAHKAVIPEAGHTANLDQPLLFNKAVAEFLEGL